MEENTPWPHAPTHRLSRAGTYFVTVGTYNKQHILDTSQRLDVAQRGLFQMTERYGWQLQAWAVFSNHYHFVADSPPSVEASETLPKMLQAFHSKLAVWLNKLDNKPERKVFQNSWDTHLQNQITLMTRLRYVHENAVHHDLVPVASQCPWCSAPWLQRSASPAQINTLNRFKIDQVQITNPYTPREVLRKSDGDRENQ